MQSKVKTQRDVPSKLILLSTHHKAPLDIKAAMTYPLGPVSLALCNADRSIRKAKRLPLYEAAMAELVIIRRICLQRKNCLPISLALQLLSERNWKIVRQLSNWPGGSCLLSQNNLILLSLFLIPIYLTALKVEKEDAMMKAKDMSSSLPACDYLLICQISLGMVKTKKCSSTCWKMISLKKNKIYIKWPCTFPIKVGALKSHQQVLQQSANFVSDYGEVDAKLVALVNAFNSSGNTLLVRSTSGDIDILMLFLLHQFENKPVLIDNGTGSSRKIIDMSSKNLTQLQRHCRRSCIGRRSCSQWKWLCFVFLPKREE